MGKIKKYIASIIFIMLFIAPYTISVFLSESDTNKYFLLLLLCYVVYVCLNISEISSAVYEWPFILSLIFIIFGALNLIIKGSTETFNLLGPIIAYIAYFYINKTKIKSGVMDLFLIGLYVYYIIVYYTVIPHLLFHPETEDFFGKASSNAIPITLNISLYAYMILNKFFDQSNHRKIIFFAFINFVLIIIQQSRGGIIVSALILFIACFEYSKKVAFGMLALLGFATLYLLVFHLQDMVEYIDILGDISANSLKDDIRGDAQSHFFNSMNIQTAIIGYSKENFAGLDYTFNVFLDVWTKYGIICLISFLLILIYRFIFSNQFKFPLYYFIPFLVYALFESQFFPNFWDVIIYLILFAPKRKIQSSALGQKVIIANV